MRKATSQAKSLYKERKENGLCIQCGIPSETKSWCNPHYAQEIEIKRKFSENHPKYFQNFSSKKRVDERREILKALKDKPCLDCGVKYPHYIMEFDHREGEVKLANVSTMINNSIKVMIAETKKCDLVCSNCHQERTWQRIQKNKT